MNAMTTMMKDRIEAKDTEVKKDWLAAYANTQTMGSKGITYLKEITVWDKAPSTPNHTYIIDNATGWALGYIKMGCSDEEMFKKPLKQFSKSWRKFVAV